MKVQEQKTLTRDNDAIAWMLLGSPPSKLVLKLRLDSPPAVVASSASCSQRPIKHCSVRSAKHNPALATPTPKSTPSIKGKERAVPAVASSSSSELGEMGISTSGCCRDVCRAPSLPSRSEDRTVPETEDEEEGNHVEPNLVPNGPAPPSPSQRTTQKARKQDIPRHPRPATAKRRRCSTPDDNNVYVEIPQISVPSSKRTIKSPKRPTPSPKPTPRLKLVYKQPFPNLRIFHPAAGARPAAPAVAQPAFTLPPQEKAALPTPHPVAVDLPTDPAEPPAPHLDPPKAPTPAPTPAPMDHASAIDTDELLTQFLAFEDISDGEADGTPSLVHDDPPSPLSISESPPASTPLFCPAYDDVSACHAAFKTSGVDEFLASPSFLAQDWAAATATEAWPASATADVTIRL